MKDEVAAGDSLGPPGVGGQVCDPDPGRPGIADSGRREAFAQARLPVRRPDGGERLPSRRVQRREAPAGQEARTARHQNPAHTRLQSDPDAPPSRNRTDAEPARSPFQSPPRSEEVGVHAIVTTAKRPDTPPFAFVAMPEGTKWDRAALIGTSSRAAPSEKEAPSPQALAA